MLTCIVIVSADNHPEALTAEAEALDNCSVSITIALTQVVEQATAATDELQEAATGVMIMNMGA